MACTDSGTLVCVTAPRRRAGVKTEMLLTCYIIP